MTMNRLRPLAMNHYASQTTDMGVTHRFWTEVMGFEMVGALRFAPRTVSTGESVPAFIHTFYAMADGSCVAFFELADSPQRASDGWPAWTRHLALSVGSRSELAQWIEHFAAHGVAVDGEIDHDGRFYSIYVTDPNGIRIELTYQPAPFTAADAREGVAVLEKWLVDRAGGFQ